ncbi:hypothetical protein LCGC14_1507540 [marine sediment metagenome]|uniref:Uncharacterized protein n=1 Tax=marine sediment metagenome TaxID=412755 RepID=A0A0F9M3P0_9ZZZZ
MVKDTKRTQVTIKVRTVTHAKLKKARRTYMVKKDIDISLAEFTDRVVTAGIKSLAV